VFVIPDADRFINPRHEDLAVPDFARSRGANNGCNGLFPASSLEGWRIASIFCIKPKTSRESLSR
jgi:hypothetical protein